MLICGDCSTQNNDGESFCSNCGAYLVWQREPAEAGDTRPAGIAKPFTDPGPAMETVLMPKLPPPPDHAPSRASARATGGTSGGAPPRARRNAAKTSRAPRVSRMAGGSSEEGAPGVVTAQKPAGSVASGDEGPGGAVAGPVEVKPGRRTSPAPEIVQPTHDEPAPAPGELVCGRCGAGNNPGRNFCRRCAASLKEAAVVPPPPWWRRLVRHPAKPALPAGTRPKRKRRRFPAGLVSFLAVVGLLGGAVYLGRDAITGAAARVQDNLLSADVRAKSIQASSSAPDRVPELAIDTLSNRSWAAGVSGNTSDQFLDVVFEREFRLAYIYISAGASNDQDDFIKERRPRIVEITAGQPDGARTTKTFALRDVTARQEFYIGADRVSAVRLRILDSTGPDDQAVAVAEVQFSGR